MRIGERSFLKRREERWSKNFDAFHPVVVTLAQEEKRESALVFRLAIAGAVILHLVLVVITFPVFDHTPMESKSSQRVYRVRQVRFVPPPQQQIKRSAPRPKARRIPVPDPTPQDPEPIELEEVDAPPVHFPDADPDVFLSIPDGPPGPSVPVYQITGEVEAPIRIHTPQPVYTEEARLARLQGVVVLQTIIDTLGQVTDIRVLKGLPSGLTESATEAVSNWRFEPATLDGEPVPVYYLVTISFSVQ